MCVPPKQVQDGLKVTEEQGEFSCYKRHICYRDVHASGTDLFIEMAFLRKGDYVR